MAGLQLNISDTSLRTSHTGHGRARANSNALTRLFIIVGVLRPRNIVVGTIYVSRVLN